MLWWPIGGQLIDDDLLRIRTNSLGER